jgi:hypothetical protein
MPGVWSQVPSPWSHRSHTANSSNSSDNKKPFNKNKTWIKESDDTIKFSKKELNALVKKASEKAVKKATKELNAVAKHKQGNENNDSTSYNQLKNFNFKAVGEVEV